MKWINVRPHAAVNEDGTAGIGRYGEGDWFFTIGGEVFEGFATRDDAIDAAEAFLAVLQEPVTV